MCHAMGLFLASLETLLCSMACPLHFSKLRVYQMEEPQLILCACLKCILLHGVLGNLTTNKDAAAYCCATIGDSTARTLVFRFFPWTHQDQLINMDGIV